MFTMRQHKWYILIIVASLSKLSIEAIEHLKINRVDLTLLHRATPVLAYQVIHTGRLIFSCSEKI